MQLHRLSAVAEILLFTILLAVVGCGTPNVNGYKQVTVDKGIARFHFEYPSDWKLLVREFQLDYTYFSVGAPRLKKYGTEISSTYWDFLVGTPTKESPNAAAALKNWVSRWEKELDFEVLESSKVEIDGIPAEQAVYTYRYRLVEPNMLRYTEETEVVIKREIFFDYNGLVWEIKVDSNLEVAEAHKVYFEYLLQTFKILR